MWNNLFETLLLLVVGMTGVFSALLLLAGIIGLFRWSDERLNRKRISSYSKKVETQRVNPDINDEIIAVITAAAEAVLKRPVVVRTMHFLGDSADGSWSATGRSTIMSSHTIDRKNP
jgi:Na+-transporting methylmalonyl-CoA/oxaloacetate decarboxylase gamma subunit